MFCLIMGGMMLQYPVGKLSDIFDRRLVVVIISLLVMLTSLLFMFLFKNYVLSLVLITLFGGFTFTIYPISISYSCDALESKDIVAGIQALLLSYSLGATLGPFVAPIFMHKPNENGLFIYFILVFGCIASVFLWRKTQKESPPQEEPFQIMTQTTPVMSEIDPRAE